MKAMRLAINDVVFIDPKLFGDECRDASAYEHFIRWDETGSGIRWPIDGEPILSPKDQARFHWNMWRCSK